MLLVDSERLAARIGKQHWFDPRLWYAMRQPFSYASLPLLARETAAVLAGDVGLGARCLVLDLDNTLWGGLVGEEGPQGITVGEGPEGEAYSDFQEYLRDLGRRGLLLAVASKNDAEAARAPFEQNPGMRLRLEDFAAFVADWRRKPEQLVEIAEKLGLGLDALVFADDNPAECAEVAAALPAVDTLVLDVPASELVRTVAASLRFELSSSDDRRRCEKGFLRRTRGGRGSARVGGVARGLLAFAGDACPRARHRRRLGRTGRAAHAEDEPVQSHARAPHGGRGAATGGGTVARSARRSSSATGSRSTASSGSCSPSLRTRMRGRSSLDTLLLSCRVIGRTAETHLLAHVSRIALDSGCVRLRGSYVHGPRNALVADLFPRLGFVPVPGHEGVWDYDLATNGPLQSDHIEDMK